MSTTAGRAGGDQTARAQNAVAAIGERARRSNELRVEQLIAALDALASAELLPAERSQAVGVAHQLVGSAGTFGYQRVSELARQVEDVLARPGDVAGHAAAAQALMVMRQDLQAGPDGLDSLS